MKAFNNMTRVVPDQKSKFDSDELFRKLARESEVRLYYIIDSPYKLYIRSFVLRKKRFLVLAFYFMWLLYYHCL